MGVWVPSNAGRMERVLQDAGSGAPAPSPLEVDAQGAAGPGVAFIVESIPTGMEDLRVVEGVRYTEDVLTAMTNAATTSIDLTAMYWALLPDPSGPDDQGFTDAQLDALGAGAGRDLLEALRAAAARGVRIRILQAPGFSSGGSAPAQESDLLRSEFPNVVEVRTVAMGDWYGSGIMHQKIWVFDGVHVYVGSANMDWKSLTQVKELGVVIERDAAVATDVAWYFEAWWEFANLRPDACEVFDPVVRVDRTVPRWSPLVPEEERPASPIVADVTRSNWDTPLEVELNGEAGSLFVSGAPVELCGPGRTWDGDALTRTIDDARRTVSISVMDFSPVGLYSRPGEPGPVGGEGPIPSDTPVWWSDLFDALLSAALTRKVWARLLVSNWAHTSPLIQPCLVALQQAAEAGRANRYLSSGQLEIKLFEVPGWDSTAGAGREFPGHTRVNHTKYVVTDRRVNIGTSNMTWDYFSSTAGASLNADHPTLIRTLQAVFDRDWSSSYAYRLT